MKLIIGLGNPGAEYTHTRHNIGRRLIESIVERERAVFSFPKSLQAAVASTQWAGKAIYLAYPLIYMNLSGEAVAMLTAHFKIKSLDDLLIVVDDIALPFGKFRLRGEGSSGGHNGLLSIEECLESWEYPRLRIGIGTFEDRHSEKSAGAKELLKDYVLSVFDSDEEKRMEELLTTGQKACRSWALEPLAKAMNWINTTELS